MEEVSKPRKILLKEIKKFGNSAVVVLTMENMKLYELKLGDIIEFEIRLIEMGGKRRWK